MLDETFIFVTNINIEEECQVSLPKQTIIKGLAITTTNFVKQLKKIHENACTSIEVINLKSSLYFNILI